MLWVKGTPLYCLPRLYEDFLTLLSVSIIMLARVYHPIKQGNVFLYRGDSAQLWRVCTVFFWRSLALSVIDFSPELCDFYPVLAIRVVGALPRLYAVQPDTLLRVGDLVPALDADTLRILVWR